MTKLTISRYIPLAGRFWSKVHPSDGCWLWTGRISKITGYGSIDNNNKALRAHRVSWELQNSPIPDGMNVLHSCDTPACINPAHLFLGTHQDNVADMCAKGRNARGNSVGGAKLTEKDALEIRTMYAAGDFTHRELAHRFGVHKSNISYIILGKSWAASDTT